MGHIDDYPQHWELIALTQDGNDFIETVIKEYHDLDHAISVVNRWAESYGMRFKSDESLFGGYWIAEDHTCYWIR